MARRNQGFVQKLGLLTSLGQGYTATPPPQPVPSPSTEQEQKPATSVILGLTIKVLQVKGHLESASVQQALEAELSRFEKCYRDAKSKGVKLPATVDFQVTISKDGKVIKVRQVGKTLSEATLAKSLMTAVKETTFPKLSSGQVEVRIQFRLVGR
jgi:hypothetical protein